MGRLLLLSGGIDSTALAVRDHWDGAVTINYGQRPAKGEIRAATAIASALGLRHTIITVDASEVGSGLLSGASTLAASPAPEWWPFRNQLLATLAAAYALAHDYTEIGVGSVAGDGARHKDGTSEFFDALNTVVSMQEGNVRVVAPAIHLTALELVHKAGATAELLGWTHSCHRSELACGACPGCWKRAELLGAYLGP